MSSERRRIEAFRISEEGRQAALAGKHPASNPYAFMDSYQWLKGFDIGISELDHAEKLRKEKEYVY